MLFESIEEFNKDFKKLFKRYRSLQSDLEDVKIILRVKPNERNPFSFRIDNLGISTCVIKIKKITDGGIWKRYENTKKYPKKATPKPTSRSFPR